VFIEYAGDDSDDQVFALSNSGGPSPQSAVSADKRAPELVSAPSESGGNSYWTGKAARILKSASEASPQAESGRQLSWR
jgi:hypothetical protein